MSSTTPHWAKMAINIVGFQIVWFLCVYGAAKSILLPGLLAALIFSGLVLWLSPAPRRDLLTISVALPIGFIMDSILARSGLISFSNALPSTEWAPLWIMALWLGFAFTLNHSLKTIYNKGRNIFLFGLFGGPLAYAIAAYKFNAMSFNANTIICLIMIGMVWANGLLLIRYIDNTLNAHQGSRA